MPNTQVCERCAHGTGKHTPTTPRPSMKKLQFWNFDGVAEASDGCQVEPDGKCEHGHSSWLLLLGYI